MQGLGILVMIFYHLFNPHDASQYADTVVGNLGRSWNPVPLYCLLSGYGLYLVNHERQDKNRWNRCLKLYGRYWLITFVFILFSLLVSKPVSGSLSIRDICLNMIDWRADYYLPAWFILPYCILSVSALWIFRATDKMRWWLALGLSYIVYMVASRLNSFAWFQVNLFQSLYLLFPFVLGGIMARMNFVEQSNEKLKKVRLIFLLCFLVALVIARYFVFSGAVISFYWAAVVIVILQLTRRSRRVGSVLAFFGKHNLNMWMIHAWICWYLFRPQVYGIGNFMLIYMVVVGISLMLSLLFNVVVQPIEKRIFTNHAK